MTLTPWELSNICLTILSFIFWILCIIERIRAHESAKYSEECTRVAIWGQTQRAPIQSGKTWEKPWKYPRRYLCQCGHDHVENLNEGISDHCNVCDCKKFSFVEISR